MDIEDGFLVFFIVVVFTLLVALVVVYWLMLTFLTPTFPNDDAKNPVVKKAPGWNIGRFPASYWRVISLPYRPYEDCRIVVEAIIDDVRPSSILLLGGGPHMMVVVGPLLLMAVV